MSKATEKLLGEIHELLGEYFKDILKNSTPTPQEVANIIRFLSNNDITCDKEEGAKLQSKLQSALDSAKKKTTKGEKIVNIDDFMEM